MGCDIHLAVEVRKDGKWERRLPPDGFHADEDLSHLHAVPQLKEWKLRYNKFCWYDDRNYNLFAMLADVRNAEGEGFAGCVTGDPYTPLSKPRDLPNDVSMEVANLRHLKSIGEDIIKSDDDIWLGDHSHSWLTLDELLGYDWEGVNRHCGWVTAKAYEVWKRDKKPDTWCGGVMGSMIRKVSNNQMDHLIKDGDTDHVYTQVDWVETHSTSAGRFYTKLIPALVRLKNEEGVGAEDVRIVFGFDS